MYILRRASIERSREKCYSGLFCVRHGFSQHVLFGVNDYGYRNVGTYYITNFLFIS